MTLLALYTVIRERTDAGREQFSSLLTESTFYVPATVSDNLVKYVYVCVNLLIVFVLEFCSLRSRFTVSTFFTSKG